MIAQWLAWTWVLSVLGLFLWQFSELLPRIATVFAIG